jgi:hypothetical protein
MDDYLAAIDDGKGKYVDATRLGCVGASYGGYSAFYLAGIHTTVSKLLLLMMVLIPKVCTGLLRKFSLRTGILVERIGIKNNAVVQSLHYIQP